MAIRLLCLCLLSLATPIISANPPFDVDYTRNIMHFAYGAYCSEASLSSWTCHYCKPGVKFVANVVDGLTETLVFIAYDPAVKIVYVSFRGSANIPNWMTDFDFIKVSLLARQRHK